MQYDEDGDYEPSKETKQEFSFTVEIKTLTADSSTHIVELGNVLLSVTVIGLVATRAIYINRQLFFSDKAMYAGRTPMEMLRTLFETQWVPHVQIVMTWVGEHSVKLEDN